MNDSKFEGCTRPTRDCRIHLNKRVGSWLLTGCLRLIASEFATEHRAEYEIMKIAFKTVQAKQGCNLI